MPWRRKSYDELPALSVRRSELRRTMRLIVIAYVFGVAWFSCVSGGQLKIFCRMVGFSDFHFGLMGALPFVATFAQLIASILIERTGLRKYQFVHCATAHRLLWFVVAAVPLLMTVPSKAAVYVMLVVLGMSWLMNALAVPAGITWLGDLIPRRIRGRYMASRERVGVVVQIAIAIVIGLGLDAVAVEGLEETAQAQPALLRMICVVFVIAAVLGIIDIWIFRGIREVLPSSGAAPRRTPTLHELLVEPLENRVFRGYVAFGATLTFSMTVAGWYFWLHAMEAMRFSKLATNFPFLVIGPSAGILAARGWGKLIDRWGRRPVLILSAVGTVLSILPWLFLAPGSQGPQFVADGINSMSRGIGSLAGRPDWTWVTRQAPTGAYLLASMGCAIGGAAWVGVSLAQIGVVLGFSDSHGRSKYVAASSVLISLGGMLGGIVGGTLAQLLQSLQARPIAFGPFVWNNWHITFLVAVAARILSLIWLVGMPDPGAQPVRHLLRYWGSNIYNNFATRLFYPLRIFGWGRARGGGEPPSGPARKGED